MCYNGEGIQIKLPWWRWEIVTPDEPKLLGVWSYQKLIIHVKEVNETIDCAWYHCPEYDRGRGVLRVVSIKKLRAEGKKVRD